MRDSNAASGIENWQRWRRDSPCPVCGGSQESPRGKGVRCSGYLSSDGAYIYCSREEHANGLPRHAGSACYAHRAAGPCRCGTSHGEAHDLGPTRGSRKRDAISVHLTRETLRKAAEFSAEGAPVTDEYDYRDMADDLRLIVFRIEFDDGGKTFRQGRPSGEGYILSSKGADLVPFHLQELRAAIEAGDPVYVVEGEKDVLAVESAGFPATCNPMGAGKPVSEYAPYFKGAGAVRIVADRDAPGRAHARAWAEVLEGVARVVEIVEPVEGNDAHDVLEVHNIPIDRAFRLVETVPSKLGEVGENTCRSSRYLGQRTLFAKRRFQAST